LRVYILPKGEKL